MVQETKLEFENRDLFLENMEDIDQESSIVLIQDEDKFITPNKEYQFVPSGGSTNLVLTKTEDGAEWLDVVNRQKYVPIPLEKIDALFDNAQVPSNLIQLIGSFASGTPEEERYVWINGTKYTLDEEFNFVLEDVVWKFGDVLDGIKGWFGNGLKSLTYVHGMDEIENANSMFNSCSQLTDISGLKNWNTSKVTALQYTFYKCSSLVDISPIEKWNVSNVKSLNSTLRATGIYNLDAIKNWDVQNVSLLSHSFRECKNLQKVELPNWNTLSVENASNIFRECTSLQSVDLSGWNTPLITDLSYMFRECTSLQSVDLSGWNVALVTNINNLFYQCNKIETIKLSEWNVPTNFPLSSLFMNCSTLKNIDLTNWDATNIKNVSELLSKQTSLETLDLSGWKNIINNITWTSWLYNTKIKELSFKDWDFSNQLDNGSKQIFSGARSLTTLTGPFYNWSMSVTGISQSPLSVESAVTLLNALAISDGKSLTLHSSTYSQLTPEQIAIATAKGWTVASA